ncbi:hypothetical protein AVEN_49389-1 [Araneus ventricosus]|uniref:Uncharacterized protein n=1 Tax=Araneus ventricosus TaxID=182803 RepID=A0A4Y2CQP9_ARAVE|nr:hypothetical protein AVEN_49389-1 [Araneus ventricosus]
MLTTRVRLKFGTADNAATSMNYVDLELLIGERLHIGLLNFLLYETRIPGYENSSLSMLELFCLQDA